MSAVDADLTAIDEFCGAGGESIGLRAAGFKVILAINHWDRAIETHSRNFRDADHWCEDTSKLDMRRLPHARILWASPICTEVSPAGGKKRNRKQAPGQEELELAKRVPKAALIRTRATFYDVLRSVEVRRFDAVLIENVVEVAKDWELFDWWVEAMKKLGYNVQFVSVSAAHIGGEGNDYAPQWRDRLYLVFTKVGIRLPDVEPRPLAWCEDCREDTHAIQVWKKQGVRKIGKYGQQYVYVCERSACRHAQVEPYCLPAAAAIDWSDLGTRIGEKPPKAKYGGLPLAPNTLRRIEIGRQMFGQPITVEAQGNTYERPGSGYVRAWPAYDSPTTTFTTDPTKGIAVSPDEPMCTECWHPSRAHNSHCSMAAQPLGSDGTFLFSVNHGGDDPRAFRPGTAPLPARTARLGDGLVVPFMTELRGGRSTARPIDHPLATMTANGRHHGLSVPDGAFVDVARTHNRPTSIERPLAPMTTGRNHSLVIPFRRGAKPHLPGAKPFGAQLTRVQDGLAYLDNEELMACSFRMLQPRETLRAQRFPDDYEVTGTGDEQYMQAGNAVATNVAQWLGTQLRAVLDQAVAA